MAGRGRKALKVLGGIAAMAAFAAIALAILFRYAGGWGVPYFTFTTERGSVCTNGFTGYSCSPTTLGDVEFFGDVDLPDDTRVVSGTYRSTHDYQLTASLEVPPASAPAALEALTTAYGPCKGDRVPPMDVTGLTRVCVIVNPNIDPETNEPTSRVYVVGTGLRADGTRVVGLTLRSR